MKPLRAFLDWPLALTCAVWGMCYRAWDRALTTAATASPSRSKENGEAPRTDRELAKHVMEAVDAGLTAHGAEYLYIDMVEVPPGEKV